MVQALIFLLFFVTSALAGPQIRVAVIDTGLDLTDSRFKNVLCHYGHEDFTGTGLKDTNGHGTHVAGLIKQYSNGSNYCLIVLKYHTGKLGDNTSYINALRRAFAVGADVINFSSDGGKSIPEEEFLLKTHPKVIMVAAAGNDSKNLDDKPRYPASYPLGNIVVVGNCNKNGKFYPTSNYGSRVRVCEDGRDAFSTLPHGRFGAMSGSSMSAGIFTGKMIGRISK